MFSKEIIAFQMREIRHDNINHFIGAYVKPGRVFILTQFALRGSLEVSRCEDSDNVVSQ